MTSSCRTTVYGPDNCPVTVSADGSVKVDDKPCRIEDIPKRLKSIGFADSAMIRVSVPDGVQREVLSKVSSALVSGGYTRFFFVKPLQKESFAKEKPSKAPQSSANPAPK